MNEQSDKQQEPDAKTKVQNIMSQFRGRKVDSDGK
jgi:hypothetical protein